MKTSINKFLGTLPVLGKYFPTFRPGHYYSPIVDAKALDDSVFEQTSCEGIDLNIDEQLFLLERMNQYVPVINRYAPKNNMFPYTDAHVLGFMLKWFKPRSIVEAGCGWSSKVMLDNAPYSYYTFIDPNMPEFLRKERGLRMKRNIQNIQLAYFRQADLLFIDTSHVCKTGSDVHHILFNILPVLRKGCAIHFHDVFFPFEYPKDWVTKIYRGFGWNEAYFLKAFLTNNKEYKIAYWDSCLRKLHPEKMKYGTAEGGSLWIQKL